MLATNDELGIELFVRNRTRLVRLSDAGRELVAMAKHALESAQNIKEAAREYSTRHDGTRDKKLRAIDASHLFEANTIQIGIRRNHYLRGYMFAFIEMFAPHLRRSVVEHAITKMATRSAKVEEAIATIPNAGFRQ